MQASTATAASVLTFVNQCPAVPAQEEEVAISPHQRPAVSRQQRAVGTQRQRLALAEQRIKTATPAACLGQIYAAKGHNHKQQMQMRHAFGCVSSWHKH
jgi:hypothetical protein